MKNGIFHIRKHDTHSMVVVPFEMYRKCKVLVFPQSFIPNFSVWQNNLSKEECKYQDLIQSSTTPDPGHHMGKLQRKYHIRLFPAADHKSARNRQDNMTMKNMKH